MLILGESTYDTFLVVFAVLGAIFVWNYCRQVAALESLAKDIKTLADQTATRRDTSGSKQ